MTANISTTLPTKPKYGQDGFGGLCMVLLPTSCSNGKLNRPHENTISCLLQKEPSQQEIEWDDRKETAF